MYFCPYQTLKLSRDPAPTQKQIGAAYRQRVREVRTDKNPTAEQTKEEVYRVTRAGEVLRNDELRRVFDHFYKKDNLQTAWEKIQERQKLDKINMHNEHEELLSASKNKIHEPEVIDVPDKDQSEEEEESDKRRREALEKCWKEAREREESKSKNDKLREETETSAKMTELLRNAEDNLKRAENELIHERTENVEMKAKIEAQEDLLKSLKKENIKLKERKVKLKDKLQKAAERAQFENIMLEKLKEDAEKKVENATELLKQAKRIMKEARLAKNMYMEQREEKEEKDFTEAEERNTNEEPKVKEKRKKKKRKSEELNKCDRQGKEESGRQEVEGEKCTPEKKALFECNECGKQCESEKTLRRHARTHVDTFPCKT